MILHFRWFFLIIYALVLCSCATACHKNGLKGPLDRSDAPLEIIEITDEIRVVRDHNYWGANSMYFVSDNSIFFLDATYLPSTAGRIIWKSMTQGFGEFKGVLVSSYHIHRTGGLSEFHRKGIPVLATVETEEQILRLWPTMQRQMNLFSTWPDPPMPAISETIRKNETLYDGLIEVIPLPPCYSTGNLAFFFPEERILYAGSVLSIPLRFDNDVKEETMQKCISIFRKKKPRIIVAGHGEPVQGREFLDRFERYIRMRKKE